MHPIPAEQTLAKFDQLVADLRLTLGDAFPLKREADLIREYYQDREILNNDDGWKKWGHRDQEFGLARISLERFVDAVKTLRGVDGARKVVKDVITGSLSQDFQSSQAKDKLYELELAAALKASGFDVKLTEPDIVVSGGGLSTEIGIACKYPSSKARLHPLISKGYQQIAKKGIPGAVAIGLELLIGQEAGWHGVLDFRRSSVPAEQLFEQWLNRYLNIIQTERTRDYPDERPLNGLILTVSVAGLNGDPVDMTFLHSLTLGCLPGNPLQSDLETIKQRLETLP